MNASHISATVGNSQRFYIAAQGPLPNTVHNFWAMVLECDVHLIVMLTEVSGVNKPSACIPYWPQNEGSSLEIGDFTITKVNYLLCIFLTLGHPELSFSRYSVLDIQFKVNKLQDYNPEAGPHS